MPPPDWNLLERNAQTIVDAIPATSIPVYLFLTDRLADTGDVSKDYVYQFVFRSFYGMDNAGLTDDFKTEFFSILQGRRNRRPRIARLCLRLHGYHNRKDKKTIQFSFVTKLAHTVAPRFPPYDSEVAHLFRFRYPSDPDPRQKIARYLKDYRLLRHEYRRIVRLNLLPKCLAAFQKRYGAFAGRISMVKQLDFICWSAGRLLREEKIH